MAEKRPSPDSAMAAAVVEYLNISHSECNDVRRILNCNDIIHINSKDEDESVGGENNIIDLYSISSESSCENSARSASAASKKCQGSRIFNESKDSSIISLVSAPSPCSSVPAHKRIKPSQAYPTGCDARKVRHISVRNGYLVLLLH
jgi:hypothetical protein